MKVENLKIYRCPITGGELELEKSTKIVEGNIVEGILLSNKVNKKYFIKNGIPDFTIVNEPEKEKNEYAVNLFKVKANEYDNFQHLSFETFYEDETDVRNSMIDKLHINSNSKILEVNAGTGRDSILISKRLSKNGLLHVQDISREMLEVCKHKLQNVEVPIEIHQGDACKLPYPDKS